jgi:hypothetical protein
MRDATALMTALTMMRRPSLSRTVRSAPLPRGITFLLEVAAADADALADAGAITGQSEERLIDAASFFVEQVLLYRSANSYRVLGATREESTAELRHHMALLMKWLHPDTVAARAGERGIDRTVFAPRVIAAWEVLKTTKSRAAYDAAQAKGGRRTPKPGTVRAPAGPRRAASPGGPRRPGARPLGSLRLEILPALRDWFWSSLFRYFPGGR